jgi:hypothetical protein
MARALAIPAAALILLLAVVAAGCGGSHSATPPAGSGSGTTTAACRTKAQRRALVKLDRDLVGLKSAGRVHVKNTLLGGRAANRATDRFLRDLAESPISNLRRNRLIDHAAASIVGNCQQCFQALEAERPIPSIAHDANGARC